jgi:hypothetical protein
VIAAKNGEPNYSPFLFALPNWVNDVLIVHVAQFGRYFLRDCLQSVYMRDGEVGIEIGRVNCGSIL